ncbi:MAG: imidazolonepropionase, partial [Proteobacteria bacterium]|nr:imidazolonepropionase [Pseudomonadota bacterium]
MPYLSNCALVYPCSLTGGQTELHPIAAGTVAWRGDTIGWVGAEKDLPMEWKNEQPIDCKGGIALPGLIDCHTHLAFAGWRADEFVERLQGKSYLEIAARGGGILSTVEKTRAASKEALLARCQGFLQEMASLGVTTIECKSGYGLSLEAELKILEVYAALAATSPLTIVSTFLGAHTVPRDLREERTRYTKEIIERMIPEVTRRNLATFCDVFVERTAFSIEEARQILTAASAAGLKAKLHADQLTAGGGAELAAELGAVSADHLEYASDAGIEAMAKSKVVAVMLPLASLYTRERAT